MGKFFEKFKRLNDYEADEDEKEAGIERLNKLSTFGTPLSVARRTNMTLEQCMKRPAEEIYNILIYDFEQSEFEKRLRKIKEDNQSMANALNKK